MELQAVIKGLESLKRPCKVALVTDSQYVGKGLSEWLPKWKEQGWRRRERNSFKPVVNEDLWRTLDALAAQHAVRVEVILGHNGHPENEACDRMAVAAYKDLMADQRR
jgi:ribonuclease HI